jgi:4-hydroxybenzoate polyprenyltransferase
MEIVQALGELRLWLLVASVLGSAGAIVMLGTVGHVEMDRRRRRETVAARHGRRTAVAVSSGFAAFGIAESTLLVTTLASDVRSALAGLVLWAFGIGATVFAHRVAASARSDEDARPAVAWAVRAFVGLHLGAAAMITPWIAALAAIALAGIGVMGRKA